MYLAFSNASSSSFSLRLSFSTLNLSFSACSFCCLLISCCSSKAFCLSAFSLACFLNCWKLSAICLLLTPVLEFCGEFACAKLDHELAFLIFCSCFGLNADAKLAALCSGGVIFLSEELFILPVIIGLGLESSSIGLGCINGFFSSLTGSKLPIEFIGNCCVTDGNGSNKEGIVIGIAIDKPLLFIGKSISGFMVPKPLLLEWSMLFVEVVIGGIILDCISFVSIVECIGCIIEFAVAIILLLIMGS